MRLPYKVMTSAAMAVALTSIPMITTHAAAGDFYNQTTQTKYSRTDLMSNNALADKLQGEIDAKNVVIKEISTGKYLDYNKANAAFIDAIIKHVDVTTAVGQAVTAGKTDATKEVLDAYKSATSTTLTVSSVNAITKTSVTVTLADGQDDAAAANKASYAVKVGDKVVEVSNVTYVKDLKKATLTLDLSGKEGALTVNTVAAKDAFDFKTPEIKAITPLSETMVYVEFSEKVDATALTKGNYSIVQKGTANVKNIVAPTKVSDTKVRLTLADADKFTVGTAYTVSVNAIKDVAGNAMVAAINTDFVGVKDTVKPTVASVVATDGNAVTVTMNKEVAVGTLKVVINPYKADGTVDTTELTLVAGKTVVSLTDATKVTTELVNTKGNLLKNGAKYKATVTGLVDLSGNTMDSQSLDFTGVNDEVAPTITDSAVDAKAKTLTLTFSEKVENGTFTVFDAATGVFKATVTGTTTDNKIAFDISSLDASKAYTLKVSEIQDKAVNPNKMADQFVSFTTPAATVAKAGLATVTSKTQSPEFDIDGITKLPALKENTVTVTFDNVVTKAEAENIANYAIAETATPANKLAVTKAVLGSDNKTVTVTTANQKQPMNYTLTVSGLSNLNADKATGTFVGFDIVAPQLQAVTPLNLNYVDVTFDEELASTQDTLNVTCLNADSLTNVVVQGKTVGTDKKTLRLQFADTVLTKGTVYTLKVAGVKDVVGNFRVNDKTDAVSVTKTFTAAEDTTVPALTGITVDNAAKVELAFSKELSAIQAGATFKIKDADGNEVKDVDGGAVTFVADASSAVVSGKVITLSNAKAFLEDGKTYTLVATNVKDLAGNAAANVTSTFVGKKDTTKPKLASAAATSVKDAQGKLNTKVSLSFDKQVDISGLTDAKLVVTNASTFATVAVKEKSAKLLEDKKTVEFTLADTTEAGIKYRVFVDGGVKDLSVPSNDLDTTASVALFDGVDTTAPTLGNTTITGKTLDGKTDISAAVTVDNTANTVTINLAGITGNFNFGGIKLSETAAVTVDAINNNFDISTPVTISKDITDAQLASMLSAIFNGSNGIQDTTIRANSGSTITLKDVAGNTRTYTLAVAQ